MSFFYLRFFKNGFLSAQSANRQNNPYRLGSEPKTPRRRVDRNGLTRKCLRGGVDKRPPRWIIMHPHRVVLDLFGSVWPASPFLPSSFPPSGETKTTRKRKRKRNEAKRGETKTERGEKLTQASLSLGNLAERKRNEAKRGETKTERGEARRSETKKKRGEARRSETKTKRKRNETKRGEAR